jgi:hypothetical protein
MHSPREAISSGTILTRRLLEYRLRFFVAPTSQELSLPRSKVGAVFIWCLPCLLGLVLFFFSFPIDRQIPFWPRLTIVEIFFLWFIFVTPITTVIAFVVFVKRRGLGGIAGFTRLLIWATITVSMLVNVFMLVAMWAAIYY